MTRERFKEIRVALGCVLRKSQEGDLEVLLVKRFDPKFGELHQRWELPGGKIEKGESPAETVRREVLEETGFQVTPIKRLVPVWTEVHSRGLNEFEVAGDFIVFERKGYKKQTYLRVYVECWECRLDSNIPQEISSVSKVSDAKWFSVSDLEWSSIIPGSREFIWHVVRQYGVDVPKYESMLSYAAFTKIYPEENNNRRYVIIIQKGDNNYILTMINGRLGEWERMREKVFYDELSLYKEVRKRILLRRRHKYKLSSFSPNFMFPHLLEGFPKGKDIEKGIQLAFPL